VHAEVKPEDKASIIRSLQQKGERVAYVGDGINDAPALEQADLGIAVTRASDIAREAADILLLKADIEAIPEALDMARATLRTIKQNLFWAFFLQCGRYSAGHVWFHESAAMCGCHGFFGCVGDWQRTAFAMAQQIKKEADMVGLRAV
jgi:P-type E1-E2 ATPase